MKIKKGDLYFYNDGKGCYIVKATGVTNNSWGTFEGEVVYLNGEHFIETKEGDVYSDFDSRYFIHLSNKITEKVLLYYYGGAEFTFTDTQTGKVTKFKRKEK